MLVLNLDTLFTVHIMFTIIFALVSILTSHPSYSHKTETSIVHENSISWGELLVKKSSLKFMKKWAKTTLIRCKNLRLIPQLIFGAQRKLILSSQFQVRSIFPANSSYCMYDTVFCSLNMLKMKNLDQWISSQQTIFW